MSTMHFTPQVSKARRYLHTLMEERGLDVEATSPSVPEAEVSDFIRTLLNRTDLYPVLPTTEAQYHELRSKVEQMGSDVVAARLELKGVVDAADVSEVTRAAIGAFGATKRSGASKLMRVLNGIAWSIREEQIAQRLAAMPAVSRAELAHADDIPF